MLASLLPITQCKKFFKSVKQNTVSESVCAVSLFLRKSTQKCDLKKTADFNHLPRTLRLLANPYASLQIQPPQNIRAGEDSLIFHEK